MNELAIMELEHSDIRTWDLAGLRSQLEQGLATYGDLVVYSEGSIQQAKKDRSTLNKMKKVIEDARKAYKKECLAPYEQLEPSVKEVVALLDQQREVIDDGIKGFESKQKEEKEQQVRKYYDQKAEILGNFAEDLYPKLLDPSWLNASTSEKKYQEELQTAVQEAYRDLQEIREMGSVFEKTLLEEYVQTLSIDSVKEKNRELTQSVEKAGLMNAEAMPVTRKSELVVPDGEDGVVMKVYAKGKQLEQLCDFMKAIGVRYEQL